MLELYPETSLGEHTLLQVSLIRSEASNFFLARRDPCLEEDPAWGKILARVARNTAKPPMLQ
jgi:hypothetical protein